MQLGAFFINAIMASLAAARYVPSDPKTCYKDQVNKKRDLEQSETKYELSSRNPMGGSIARRFTGRRQPCLDCCEASSLLCHAGCRARFSGAGDVSCQLRPVYFLIICFLTSLTVPSSSFFFVDLIQVFWLLAACQSGCSAWETGCIAACYNFPE